MTSTERKRLIRKTKLNLKTKYRLLFKNEFDIKGLEYGVIDYFMDKLLYNGRVAAFNVELLDQKMLAFGSYVAEGFDWKGDPLKVKILNEWKNSLIPTKSLNNDEEVVLLNLGFTPEAYIDEYVTRIVDIQETIDTNLTLQKMPFVINSTDTKTIRAIEEVLNNAGVVVLDDINVKLLVTNVPYVIDKLMLYKSEVEAELLSLLGIDNVKFEKKAQMTKDEVNSNEDEIDAYRKVIRMRVEDFFKQVNEVLDHNIIIEEDPDEIIEEDDNGNV